MPDFMQEQYTFQAQPTASIRFFTPVVTVLLALLLAGTCMAYWFGMGFVNLFSLTPPQEMKWKLWQLITYCFIDTGWWNLMVDVSVIVFCGSAVERLYRSRNLAVFFALTIPLFGLLMLPILMFIGGFHFGTEVIFYGMLGMFAYSYRKQKVLFFMWPVEADKLAWVAVIITALLSIPSPYTLIFVAAAPLGWWYIKTFKGAGIQLRKPSGFKPGGSSEKVRKSGFVDID
jgi:membrane associated rhomboid family serine protease